MITRKVKTEMQKKICAVYGEGAVTGQKCQKWSVKFLGTADILAIILCCGLSYALEGVSQHPWPPPTRSQ